MDCVSEGEYAAAAAGGLAVLIVFWSVGQSLFFLDGDVAKLCGIKYFSAGLALNEFGVFLSGDNFDYRVFAGGGHGGWGGEWYGFCPSPTTLSTKFLTVLMVKMYGRAGQQAT
jgi:hypothetical protein